MKLFYALIILLILSGCSFDKKSGIWKNVNETVDKDDNNIFKDFKKISSSTETFDQIIPRDQKINFKKNKTFQNSSWTDIFFSRGNYTNNFKYDDLNQKIFKSKNLTNYSINERVLFEKNNLILSDKRGNIIVYSITEKKTIAKVNFYKKKYKNVEKKINFIVDNDVIYISDNIGYIYAYNYILDQILWAKNFKIPFRSNIKLFSEKLITSNQNNDLFIFDKANGNLKKLIPSENTTINNSFINNISLSNKEIFFLNTYGSIYSIDLDNFKFNWFINLNKTLDLNLSNLFYGSKVVYFDNKIFMSSNENFYVLDSKTGSILIKKNFSSIFRPLINNDYIFLITQNNFLVALDKTNGKIIYSYDIAQQVANFINTKKRTLEIKELMLINNNIFVFLKNSHIIKFNLNGDIKEIIKLPSTLNSYPIFIDKFLIFLNKKNKLVIVN